MDVLRHRLPHPQLRFSQVYVNYFAPQDEAHQKTTRKGITFVHNTTYQPFTLCTSRANNAQKCVNLGTFLSYLIIIWWFRSPFLIVNCNFA